jgi:PAS domain S-box-containing protein
MGGFAILALFIGALLLLGLYFLVRQLERTDKAAQPASRGSLTTERDATEAVMVVSEHGQVLHVNNLALEWLGLEHDSIDLELIGSRAEPAENFFALIASQTQASFLLGKRWVNASSYFIPDADGWRAVITLREAVAASADIQNAPVLDISLAMDVINQINQSVTVSMNVETTLQVLLELLKRVIPSDAGEICLWDEQRQFLQQRGWVGDASYLLLIAESGGGYADGHGVAGWIARTRRPLLLSFGRSSVDIRDILAASPYRSAVGTPLRSGDQFVGTLAFFSLQGDTYHEGHTALLGAVASAVTTSIQNAMLYTQQEQRLNDIARLQELTEETASDRDSAVIFQRLNERIAQLIDAEMSGVFLYDEERSALLPQLPFHGLNDNVVNRIQIPVPPNSPQRDIWESQPYWVSNHLADEPLVEALGLQGILQVAGIRSTALVPMSIAGERIGFVAVSNKRGRAGFMPADIQSLRVLATQAGIIVENLRLYQREKLIDSELVGLQEMTEAIGSLEQGDHFYANISERIARLMRCSMVGILLYDQSNRRLIAQPPFYGIATELIQEYSIALPSGSVMDELWQDEEAWYSNHVQTDTLVFEAGLDALAETAGVVKTLFAVMAAGGRRIGVVQVSNPEDGRDFSDKDERLLMIFATQAAAIIENARLYREVQLRASQADRLRRVAELSSAVMTPEQPFTSVLEEISGIMDSPMVFISVLDHNTNSLISYPRYAYGIPNAEVYIIDLSNRELKASVAISGRTFFSNDLKNDSRLLSAYRLSTQKYGITSAVLVPLIIGERSIGELGVGNRRRPYTQEDVDLLSTVASQIAAAMERLLLYEATGENLRRRMQELDAIARISNELALTLDLNQVLETIRREVQTTLGADSTVFTVLRPSGQWQIADEPEVERRLGPAALPHLAPIELEAVQRGAEPVVIADYSIASLQPLPEDARSAVAIAVLYVDQIVGIIHAWSGTVGHFDERSAGFMLTVATKAALGYQNASYYQQQVARGENLRRRVDQLNRIFELGQMLQSNADIDSILEAVAYSVQQSIGYDTVLMLLVDEREGVLRRVAQAGMPLSTFEESKNSVTSLETLAEFLKPEFRTSETYFFPAERAAEWRLEGASTLSTAFPNNRTLAPRTASEWHDGDLLMVNISGQGGNLLGIMVLDRPYDNQRPDRGRIEVLEIFAHQAATMIENTRLFMESQRSAEQEAQLSAIMNAVASTLDLNEISMAIAKGLRALVPFSRLTLAVANPQTEAFDYLRVMVQDDGDLHVVQEERLSLERTALGRTFAQRRIYGYDLGIGDSRNYEGLKFWQSTGEKSSLILPLVAGGECLGSMHVGGDAVGSVTDGAIRPVMERVAQLVAGALQNARLFTQAVNLQVLNRSVVESIQQGIVVLDSSGHIINVNEFMRQRYGWDNRALRQDLFTYQPELYEVLSNELRDVLETGAQRERLGYTSIDPDGQFIVRNFYIYALRAGEAVRGAVLLVDDVTDRTRLEQAIETRANQLAALTEVSTRITSLLEREEIISLAIEEMGWIIPYDTMSIWRRNGSFMVLEGASGFADNRALLSTRLKIGDSEHVQAMVDSQRALHLDLDKMDATLGLPPGEIIKSWLGVPLVNQGHVVGMMMLTRRSAGAYATREEQHVAFAFASQVAIALANADLFEQTFERTNELGTLLEAAQATSMSRNVNEVFRTVADLMFSALEQEDATIMIWHEVENDLEVEFTINRSGNPNPLIIKGQRYDLRQFPAKLRALQKRDVIVIIDQSHAENPADYAAEIEELRVLQRGARLLVPLVVSDQAIGLIQLEQTSNDERSLTQQKVRLAKALGAQVAVAIENARLSQETNVRFEELITINTLSQAISSTLRLEDMLPIIRDQVPIVTKAEEMYLALYDPEASLITFPLAVRSRRTFEMPPRPLGNDEVSYIIRRKRTLNLGADYFGIDELRRSLGIVNGEGDVKSYLGVPLISGDDVLGVLAIRSMTRSRAFTLNDDRILTTVGSQLSAAIQNARLFERVSKFADELNELVKVRTDELEEERDRLDTLYQITSELARTLDMEQLLERALSMVSKAVSAEDGVILLADPATDSLYPRAWINPNNLIRRDGQIVSHPAISFAEWFLMNADEHDHVMMVSDLADAQYWEDTASGMRSALAVILENNEDPIGVMVLLSSLIGAFTENHIKLLVPAANQVAASINSADLYQLIRDQAERLGRLLRAEQEEAQKQGAILEGINDGVMLVDASGRVVLFNHAAERILQVPRSSILNQPILSLATNFSEGAIQWNRFLSQLQENIEKKMMGGAYEEQRIQLNEFFINTFLTPIATGDQFLGVLAVLRDVTRDVEAERTKNQFITNVSHEFRTPLTPIKGFTDLLLMGAGGNLSEPQQQMVETIKQNVERLTLLVNDVLNISKLDSRDLATTMQMVSLGEVLQGVLDQIAGRSLNIKRGYRSSVVVDNEVPRIRADREKLVQIMGNLIDNAFKYTPPGGEIAVSAHLEADKRHVLLKVKDTGVGIPEEFRDRAFNRFERYDKHALELDVAGTGLGLSLVKELVALHSGDVWFESELGKGTTFFVRLPIEQPNYATGSVPVVSTEEQKRD